MREPATRRAETGSHADASARETCRGRAAAALAVLLLAAWARPAPAAEVSSLYFFGDSLTDEGRAGRTAPVIWSQVLRRDLAIAAGGNYAIGGATTHDQPSAAFGDSSFLGQVRALAATAVPPDAEAAIWIGTNDVWIGAARGRAPETVAADAAGAVRAGLEALGRAGVHRAVVLGVYDLSLTNAFAFVGADTPATRAAAAAASRLLNERLRGLAVPGMSIAFFDVARFLDHLRADAAALGFAQVRPLRPGAVCDATCQRTSIFDDTIHLSQRTQTLIGDYVASGSPSFNDAPLDYGAAAASSLATPDARPATRSTLRRMLDWVAAHLGFSTSSDRGTAAEGSP